MDELTAADYEEAKAAYLRWTTEALERRYLPTRVAAAMNTLLWFADRCPKQGHDPDPEAKEVGPD